MELPEQFIRLLCCPKRLCRGELIEISKEKHYLKCKICGTEYPVEDGIPILFPNPGFNPFIHSRHWDKEPNAKSYANKYDSYLKKQGKPWGLYTHSSEMKAIKKLTKNIDLSGKTIIDCGCGNGRLLSSYPETGIKIGVDASLILLRAAKKREPDFWLVCCQLEDLPFKDCIADFSVSIRVFQHLKAPEHAFSEMTRVTLPSGHIALQVYNKFNLKELYKKFRMLPAINKIKPWGLSYDRYFSYREIEKWCGLNHVKSIKYSGAGWGVHFYIFEFIYFRQLMPKIIQKIVYSLFLIMEDIIGTLSFFSKTMEKVCFIGSMQYERPKSSLLKKIICIIKRKKDIRNLDGFKKVLEDRNYAFTGSDKHHLKLSIEWLKKAQDATSDAGVSRGFSLIRNIKMDKLGWQPSYPETTGYIIPTMINAGKILCDPDLIRRVKLMADWELRIMLSDGAVHGGNISGQPNPAVFDTGQVIRGLSAVFKETQEEKYLNAALKSANWIVSNECNKEGRWIVNNAKCVDQRTTTYNIYAVAPIVELGLQENNKEFKDLGIRAGDYTLSMQTGSGWYKNADFEDREDSLLHTIAYTIDGIWDIGEHLNIDRYLFSAQKAIDGILPHMDESGKMPGRFKRDWAGTVDWTCLTGVLQIAVTCMKLYKRIGDKKYLAAAIKVKNFIKTCQNNIDERYGGIGAIWGSWPIEGGYGRYQALNWPVKYFADLLIEVLKEG